MNRSLYKTWYGMVDRCTNPSYRDYKFYGAKGITVCDRWLDYGNFLKDMEATHKPWLSLDREDNTKGYSPENCRWATGKEQHRNTSTSKWWFIDGTRYDSSSQAAEELGVSKFAIISWCNGRGRWGKPKKGCYSELKYVGGLDNGTRA